MVLRIPWHGRFIWPLAVAGIGFKYLRISFSEMLGHPLRKPLRVAFRSLDIVGLHNAWCANLTLFALVEMECAKTEISLPVCVGVALRVCVGGCASCLMGMVHRSVVGSLRPCRITLSLYIISQCSLQNVTLHPALHKTRTPISDAIERLGTMCPVSVTGSPGIVTSQQCDYYIFEPSGRVMVSGFVAIRLFSTGVPSMIKIAVAPVSMIACDNFSRLECPGAPNSARAVAAID